MFNERRLIRRYFLISALLLSGGLLVSGLVEMYFRYHEIRDNIAQLQQEAAASAASKIGQVMQEIHTSMVAATRSRDVASASEEHDRKRNVRLRQSLLKLESADHRHRDVENGAAVRFRLVGDEELLRR